MMRKEKIVLWRGVNLGYATTFVEAAKLANDVGANIDLLRPYSSVQVIYEGPQSFIIETRSEP